MKNQVVEMAINGSGIRDTARALKINPTTVLIVMIQKEMEAK